MSNNRLVTQVTQRVKHVEQERDTLHDHTSSSLIFSGVRVVASLIFCVMFSRSFVPFIFTIVTSVFLRFTATDYPCGILLIRRCYF